MVTLYDVVDRVCYLLMIFDSLCIEMHISVLIAINICKLVHC